MAIQDYIVFQQSIDPVHNSIKVQAVTSKGRPDNLVMNSTSNNTDLNTVGDSWTIMYLRVAKQQPSRVEKLRNIWVNEMTPELC